MRRAVSTSPLAVRRPVPAPPPSEHESGPPAVLGSRCVKLPRGRPGAWLALRARGAKAPGSRARVRSVRLGAWGGGRRDLVNLDGGGGGGATHRTAAQRARSTFSRRLSCGSLSGERGVCVAQSTRSRYTPESGSARRHRGEEREIGSFSHAHQMLILLRHGTRPVLGSCLVSRVHHPPSTMVHAHMCRTPRQVSSDKKRNIILCM